MNILLSAVENMDEVTHALYDREFFGYVSAVLSYLNAIGLIAILIIVPLMMVLDTLYLTVPALKSTYDTYRERCTNLRDRVVQRLLVSKNAIESYEDAAVTNTSPIWCYLKRSIKFYIIVVCAVIILTTGLDTILRFTYKLLGNILDWFTNLM